MIYYKTIGKFLKIFSFLMLILFFISCSSEADLVLDIPVIEGTWPSWESIEAAGWSKEKINEAKAYWEQIDSAAVVVVYQGKVLFAWGDYKKNFLTHSIRKSFMSAVYGIYVDREIIDLSKTIIDLGIDDEPPLTEEEKKAEIIHLLQARSGIYHTAAAETESMHNYKPERGTYVPGEFWCYNNWDFNALATIFDNETETDFFQALFQDIFEKLGVEDYINDKSKYFYQLERSIHPSYGFEISARDSARFGLLFLQKGVWNNEQIISEQWVIKSTSKISDSNEYIPNTFYGLMWWVFPEGFGLEFGLTYLSRYESYAALGAYGQVIQIIPDLDLVFVHRVNSFQYKNVELASIYRLLNLIIAGKIDS